MAEGDSDTPEVMNGYYTWARLGYDCKIDKLERPEDRDRVRKAFPEARMLSDLMKTQEGRDFWKKNGGPFQGKFNLSEGSQSRKVLESYVKAKS
jgi:hypothetical protein